MRIIKSFPKSQKFQSISISHPILDNKITFISFIFRNIRKTHKIILMKFQDVYIRSEYLNSLL